MPFTPFSKATQTGKAAKPSPIEKVANKASAKPAPFGKAAKAPAKKAAGKKAPPFVKAK